MNLFRKRVCEMDLSTAMEEAALACSYFFNNRFEEARALMKPWAHKSMYHGLGYGTFMYLQAIMTFEPRDIEIAIEALKQSVDVCSKFRRKNTLGESLGKIVKKQDYNVFTKVEIHAELCYAECLLLRSVLTFMEDETLISFLKGGMKIRQCYQSYKECWHILEGRDWSKDPDKMHFESGVRMGVGAFNLMISQLPQKVLKLLEFVGFSGKRELGLSELERGFRLEGSLRQVLCALALLGYHLIATYVLGTSDGDLDLAQLIVEDHLKLYPNGALFLFFAGRLEYVKGNFELAIEKYKKSLSSQDEWRQFHHLCYWEFMWCCIMSAKFREAQEYADKLLLESKWSKATYAYQKACCMCMRMDQLTPAEKQELSETMRTIPGLKQRIAGKSLPIEKFAVKKSARFFSQGETLTLSALELIYAWNGFKILAKKYENVEIMFTIIEHEMKALEAIRPTDRGEYFWDDYLLAHLVKGSCLANMNSPLQAEECFKLVVNNEKKIKEDNYLVPNALLELGLLLLKAGDLDQSRTILEHAKNNFKSYSLESRLHFRVHATLNKISSMQKKGKGGGEVMEGLSPLDGNTPSLSASHSPNPSPSPGRARNGGKTAATNGVNGNSSKNGGSVMTHL